MKTGAEGMNSGRRKGSAPQPSCTTPARIEPRPIVTMNTEIGLSPSIGRITGIDFVAGVTQVADWSDGVGLLGYRSLGAGSIVGVNLHVITADTAYQVVNTAWGSQLMSNAVGGGTAAIPEPTTWAMMISGFGLAGAALRRRRVSVSYKLA